MGSLWDFDSIRERGDRAHSLELLKALRDPSLDSDVAHQVVRTLVELDDPRCLVTLRAIAEDTSVEVAVRTRAVSVLCESLAHPTGDDLRRWWTSGEDLLRSAALPLMDRSEADVLEAVFDDPTSVWLPEALHAIAFGFQEPIWQQRKITCLSHHDPKVRTAAARSVFWDEPLLAEAPLLALLADDDPQVAAHAAGSLAYYPSREVALALAATGYPDVLRNSQSPDPSDGVLDSFRWVLTEETEVAAQMRDWMGPVAALPGLALEAAAVGSGLGAQQSVVAEAGTRLGLRNDDAITWSETLLDRVNNPDEPLQPLLADLRLLDAESIPAAQRMRVVATMCRHADANLRERGAVLASQLDLAEPIVELLNDPCVTVRKTAVYYAHDLSQNALIAEKVIALLDGGEVASTQGREALRTWVRHVDPVLAQRRLIRFARDDQRESIAVGAIEELVTLEDPRDALQRLVGLLQRPALVTWAGHITLLDAYARLGISPGDIDHLRVVDNVWLATAIAKLDHVQAAPQR
jgi:HEAT repeat protein